MDLYRAIFVSKETQFAYFRDIKLYLLYITKIANKEILNNLSVDNLAIKLDEHLINQAVNILKIVAVLMGIIHDVVNVKSKRYVNKIIEKILEDILEDADNSEQEKKIYLIQVNTSTSNEHKDDTKTDERVKKNTKVVNDGDRKVTFKVVKSSR